MYYVYVLQSQKNWSKYIWYTSNLQKRFETHNLWLSKHTNKFKPWKLVYYECYTSKKLAMSRERALKLHGNAKQALLKRIFED